MSRSRRYPLACAESEHDDKRRAGRRLRRAVRMALAVGADVLPDWREIADRWTWAKDGAHVPRDTTRWARK